MNLFLSHLLVQSQGCMGKVVKKVKVSPGLLKGLCKGDVRCTENSWVRMRPQNSSHLSPLLLDKLETPRMLMGHWQKSGRDHTQGS